MENAILEVVPETSGEELRFESAVRGVRIHERAKTFRTIIVMILLAIAAARICLATSIGLPLRMIDTPAVYGICFLASLLTFSLEWSTRLQRQDRLQAYARCLISHRQST